MFDDIYNKNVQLAVEYYKNGGGGFTISEIKNSNDRINGYRLQIDIEYRKFLEDTIYANMPADILIDIKKRIENEIKKRNKRDNKKMTDKAIEHLQQELKEKDKTISCIIESLQVKTKECEELKKLLMQKDEVNTFFNTPIEGWSSNPCDICESKNNYEQLTQECDTLKSQLDFEVQQKECIEQECEKLKAQLEIYSKMLNNPEFKVALTEMKTGERDIWKPKAERYKQALDEIEKNIRHCIKQNICTLCAYADKCRNEFDYNAYDNNIFILDIISKAKGGNNDC